MLIHDFLPSELVDPCMEVLRCLSDNERDLVRVVAIEIVQHLRDPGDHEDEDVSSAFVELFLLFDVFSRRSSLIQMRALTLPLPLPLQLDRKRKVMKIQQRPTRD